MQGPLTVSSAPTRAQTTFWVACVPASPFWKPETKAEARRRRLGSEKTLSQHLAGNASHQRCVLSHSTHLCRACDSIFQLNFGVFGAFFPFRHRAREQTREGKKFQLTNQAVRAWLIKQQKCLPAGSVLMSKFFVTQTPHCTQPSYTFQPNAKCAGRLMQDVRQLALRVFRLFRCLKSPMPFARLFSPAAPAFQVS
jgi:hypothetical protein